MSNGVVVGKRYADVSKKERDRSDESRVTNYARRGAVGGAVAGGGLGYAVARQHIKEDDAAVDAWKHRTGWSQTKYSAAERSALKGATTGRGAARLGLAGAVGGAATGLLAGPYKKPRTSEPEATVGKGFQPRLARKAPLAGTNARLVVTGDKVNARRIIGKSDEVSKLSLGGLKSGVQSAGTGLRAGFKGQTPNLVLTGRQKKVYDGGMKVGQWAGANPGKAAATVATTGGATGYMAGRFGKAYGDPEDARYARLGAGAAGLVGVGGYAGYKGVKQVVRDTQALNAARPSLASIKAGSPPPPPRKTKQANGAGNKKRPLTPTEAADEAATYERKMANFHARGSAEQAGKKLAGVKGVVVRGRSAALLGGSGAALGGAEVTRRKIAERRWS